MALTGVDFNFSQSRSGFSNEQGVGRPDRQRIFGDPLFPTIRENVPFGIQDIRGATPQVSTDRFGFLQSPNFNAQGFVSQLLRDALAQTSASQTARGRVSPENIANTANLATQRVATQLLPLTQQNILTAGTLPAQFQLQRGQALLNPLLQSGTALATGGGSGSGSSSSLSVGGGVGFG